jgi:hypothetical protein
VEEFTKQSDRIVGFYDPATGISSGAIQLDGYTSFVERTKFGRDLPQQFTINAWLALESYPWFRSPVFDLRRAEKDGVILGVSHSGRLGAGFGRPDSWVEMEGPLLPLRQWLMLTLVVDSGKAAQVFLNGQPMAGSNAAALLGATRN